jgi:hypothetical protein
MDVPNDPHFRSAICHRVSLTARVACLVFPVGTKRPEMLEDLRNHDPNPTAQESPWMQLAVLRIIARLLALAVLAVAIGTAASQMGAPEASVVAANPQEPVVVAKTR